MLAVWRDVAHETGPGFGLQARGGPKAFTFLLLLWLAVLVPGCSETPEPITLEEGTVVVMNQTASDWRNVVVTVNDHFRGGTPTLAAGGRMAAPLTEFQTAFGQRFNRASQSVSKVELTATDASGNPVALTWSGARAEQGKD